MFPDVCEKCGRRAVEKHLIFHGRAATYSRQCFACGRMLTYQRKSYVRWTLSGLKWTLILAGVVAGIWASVVMAFVLGGG